MPLLYSISSHYYSYCVIIIHGSIQVVYIPTEIHSRSNWADTTRSLQVRSTTWRGIGAATLPFINLLKPLPPLLFLVLLLLLTFPDTVARAALLRLPLRPSACGNRGGRRRNWGRPSTLTPSKPNKWLGVSGPGWTGVSTEVVRGEASSRRARGAAAAEAGEQPQLSVWVQREARHMEPRLFEPHTEDSRLSFPTKTPCWPGCWCMTPDSSSRWLLSWLPRWVRYRPQSARSVWLSVFLSVPFYF